MEKTESGPKGSGNGPKTYAPEPLTVKLRLKPEEASDVIARAKKRGFPVLGPNSTTGLADYFRSIESESALFDILRKKKAKEAAQIMEDYGLGSQDLLEAKLRS
jgi:hypothetical protein